MEEKSKKIRTEKPQLENDRLAYLEKREKNRDQIGNSFPNFNLELAKGNSMGNQRFITAPHERKKNAPRKSCQASDDLSTLRLLAPVDGLGSIASMTQARLLLSRKHQKLNDYAATPTHEGKSN